MKKRVQHPKVNECRDRGTPYWFFRYWDDELLPDGTTKTSRKRRIIGPSRGPDAISRKQAEIERDRFLLEMNAAETPCGRAVKATEPIDIGAILFGKLADLWRRDFVERDVGGRALIAASTRAKYINHLENHILPRWKDTRIAEFRAKDVLDWLQCECESWHMMADLRNIMSGIFTKAQEWEILPDTFANPMGRVKLPRKWEVREKRILTEEQTERVLARLEDPQLLICETCVDTGTRISEVTGLAIRNVNLELGCIRIEQRNWRGDIDEPKTAKSRRTLALVALTARYRTWISQLQHCEPDAWIFPQDEDARRPMWDSGVRSALKRAAAAEGCDFPGLGPHSLRRANITWRQEVGGSSIEASQIAGHANTKITEEYTVVQLRRQEELTRRIQNKRAKAGKRSREKVVEIKSADTAA
ncbi:MAG TPA: tyrosine-type recombinase/integrase [Bryobacteraceae bacterium]